MRLIDAEKAKDVIHEYFKLLMVNGASGTDVDRLAVGIGSCLKHDANLLKAIDELPSAEPDTTTHDSVPAETDKNDGDGTSGDCISRRQAIYIASGYCHPANIATELAKLPSVQPEPCGDAVSRNAIVQKLNQMDRYVSTELRLCDTDNKFPQNEVFIVDDVYEEIVEQLPSVQPKQNEMIKEIRRWINSGNRGNADYFIVDRIEEIINSYEIN